MGVFKIKQHYLFLNNFISNQQMFLCGINYQIHIIMLLICIGGVMNEQIRKMF